MRQVRKRNRAKYESEIAPSTKAKLCQVRKQNCAKYRSEIVPSTEVKSRQVRKQNRAKYGNKIAKYLFIQLEYSTFAGIKQKRWTTTEKG